ncbi:MAG: insulinase family protein [Bacilli bacterium]|nr:insulinase family protein [Bacilli bacterium]
MKYKKYEYDNYTVHLLKTDKFKSVFVSLMLINDFDRVSLTKASLLRRLLTYSTEKLKDQTEVTKKVYDLYNSEIYVSNNIHNNVLTTDFSIEILEDKYTEDGLLKNALEYFFDTIFMPNIIYGKFEEKNYNLAVKNLNDYYNRERENKDTYAFNRACELLDEEHLRYNPSGYKDDLQKITNESMVDYYNDLFKNADSNIFVIGSFDETEILDIINNRVSKKLFKNNNNFILNDNKKECKINESTDVEENNQSNLIMIYKMYNLTKRERNVILPIFNRIFGVGNNSKLFKDIREEKSLVYDIRSTTARDEGLIIVQAGIDYKNKDEIIKSVTRVLDDMKNANITQNELEDSKKFRKLILKQFEDDNESILYLKINSILFKSDDLDKMEKELETVKLDEIVSLANKLKLNVVYILKGDKNNE